MNKSWMSFSIFTALILVHIACNGRRFSSAKKSSPDTQQTDPSFVDQADAGPDTGTPKVKTCSATYSVPATANPYLAGMPEGARLRYTFNNAEYEDIAPKQSPVLIIDTQNCISPGAKVRFQVSGSISNDQAGRRASADGDSETIVTHMNGSSLGKAQLRAPINSLVGVFLSPNNPGQRMPPAELDFSREAARNYLELRPSIGQIFFIGDGQSLDGTAQTIEVPSGATRLYLGVMDAYEWSNNKGGLNCSLQGLLAN